VSVVPKIIISFFANLFPMLSSEHYIFKSECLTNCFFFEQTQYYELNIHFKFHFFTVINNLVKRSQTSRVISNLSVICKSMQLLCHL
jgi:hypothetical protein